MQNVSIVDIATNSIVGEPLRVWDEYPGSNTGPDRDDSKKAPARVVLTYRWI